MPRRELLPYLQDILERIDRVESLVAEIGSYKTLIASNTYMDAFARNFEVIGEALFQAVKLNPELPVEDRKAIIGLRHIHDYYELEYDRLWVIATSRLQSFKAEIIDLISSENQKLFGTDNPNIF